MVSLVFISFLLTNNYNFQFNEMNMNSFADNGEVLEIMVAHEPKIGVEVLIPPIIIDSDENVSDPDGNI